MRPKDVAERDMICEVSIGRNVHEQCNLQPKREITCKESKIAAHEQLSAQNSEEGRDGFAALICML